MPPKTATTKGATKPAAKTATKAATGTKTPAKTGASKTAGSTAKGKEETKPAAAPVPKVEIPKHNVTVKEIATFLLDDVNNNIRSSKWWPYVIDESTIASQFLKYRDCNYVVGVEPGALEPGKIRLALLGALRYGKPFLFDMSPGADLYGPLKDSMDLILPGLLDIVLDKSILEEENIQKLLKDGDPNEYNIHDFSLIDGFRFIVLTDGPSPTKFSDKMMKVIVG